MNAIMFLSIRAAHVLVAGLWIGSTVFGAAWLMPAIDASGAIRRPGDETHRAERLLDLHVRHRPDDALHGAVSAVALHRRL